MSLKCITQMRRTYQVRKLIVFAIAALSPVHLLYTFTGIGSWLDRSIVCRLVNCIASVYVVS